MKSKPKILITNDDGIHAPGLASLWKALNTFADVTIIAPSQNQSGSDVELLNQGYLTGTPIHVNDLTDDSIISATKEQFEQLYDSAASLTS